MKRNEFMTTDRDYSVITREEARRQHERYLGARVRLLRAAQVTRRSRCVELGAGWGFAAVELAERSGHRVTAVDRHATCVNYMHQNYADRVDAIQAEVGQLPMPRGSFDLIFSQFAFLWFAELTVVLDEIRRLMAAGGVLATIEPDFGGMITWPNSSRLPEIWRQGLRSAGAEPQMGRKLAVALQAAGFETQVLLSDRLEPFDVTVLDSLLALPLDPDAQAEVRALTADRENCGLLCHLPVFMIMARVR